jgi:hypothetical protein
MVNEAKRDAAKPTRERRDLTGRHAGLWQHFRIGAQDLSFPPHPLIEPAVPPSGCH